MKIMVLTQEDYLYLPSAFGKICKELGGTIECVVILPAMSTHGGTLKGFVRLVKLFGIGGLISAGIRFVTARTQDLLTRPDRNGPFHSVRSATRAFDIPSRKVAKINSPEFDSLLNEFPADLLISISCPQIVRKKIRNSFPRGCINVHGSPLPHYRGLMPAFWVLRNGETETAVTVHDLSAKLDDGDILLQRKVPVSREDTWNSLVRKTKSVGADILVEAIRQIEAGTVTRKPNREEEGTYYGFPTSQDRKAFHAIGRRFF